MFLLRSVCLSVCLCLSVRRITEKVMNGFWRNFLEGYGPGTTGIKFGDDPEHRPDPGVRSPKSGFTGLSNYQRILMKLYDELGCNLETNWLHFGDDPHHYPDPGVRSGSRSGSGKNCHNSIMLAFSGGLCSLSTSSLLWNCTNIFACMCLHIRASSNTLSDKMLRTVVDYTGMHQYCHPSPAGVLSFSVPLQHGMIIFTTRSIQTA